MFGRRKDDSEEQKPSPGPFTRVYINVHVEGHPGTDIGYYNVDLSSPDAAEQSTRTALMELAEMAAKQTRDILTREMIRADKLLTDDQWADIERAVNEAMPEGDI